MNKSKNRIALIDELRGLALILMIIYHACYLAKYEFSIPFAATAYSALKPIRPFVAFLFIFISGISCSFSKSNLKRGLRVIAAAAVITAVTVFVLPLIGMPDEQIYFGILHLLGSCMLLYAAAQAVLGKQLQRAGTKTVVAFAAILFFMYLFTYNISDRYLGLGGLRIPLPERLFTTNLLAPLGFFAPDFYSADYYPIFPHVFLFFTGVCAGKLINRFEVPEWTKKERIKPLAFAGRHTFIVYILHQPVIYILLTVCTAIAG